MKDLKNFLNSFAKINSDEYVVNEYTFDLITNNSKEVFKEALDKYMNYREQNQNFKVLTNWRNEILSKYDEGCWLGKIPVNFDLQGLSPKEYLIESILEILQEQPYEVNSIEEFGTFLCSVCTENYFFVTTKGVYWLSFNVYD